ncbi:hypothetical protein [Janibacter hoylei]|uniref:hypothetical protein n=1 Tax=Janibacter hoylei TaxID=364298 RepID=UPI0021A2C860|nr:hypothetical protein [Janibacter hoylei]MCT1618366.1 hypothetical protein [Janibacter hoylei]MCT2293291.1 hypothetical protein [Janibacter hoylei]MCW4600503.1 hypothetical protein [Janibacter hoylei]
MPELPASVRVALWVTHAWSGGTTLTDAVERALPDVDHTEGLVEQVRIWRDLGEAALLVALPAPGDLGSLPRCGPIAADAAAEAGEALYVAGLGGLLVPSISTFGSAGAQGLRIDWMTHDADPVPPHRIEALEPSQLERHLRRQLLASIDELDDIGGTPWADDLARDLVDERLGTDWALPPDLPERARKVIGLAGTIAVAAEVGLTASGAVTAAHDDTRSRALRRLARVCEHSLADATNAACAQLAGWVPVR